MSAQNKTIVAISTPPGRGGIGIVRLSGDRSFDLGVSVFRKSDGKALKPKDVVSHKAYYGSAVYPNSQEKIDEALAIFMKHPNSYTCEDMVEINLHGSPVILQKIVRIFLDLGASLAEPGEFTKRAFLNGRIDLVQAEAIAELVNSKSELEMKLAARRISGELSQRINGIKDKMLKLVSEIEASIDFPEDVSRSGKEIAQGFDSIGKEIDELAKSYEKNSVVSHGVNVAIIGPTNVGKSTLFNAILKHGRAITSDEPGTTRDYLSEEIELSGINFRIFDTAGISSQTQDEIEKEGIRKAIEIIEKSDVLALVFDDADSISGIIESYEKYFNGKEVMYVLNKIDLGKKAKKSDLDILEVSALKNINVEKLEKKIVDIYNDEIGDDSIAISGLRQKSELESTIGNFKKAKQSFEENASPEFIAFDLKNAYTHLCSFTGDGGSNITEEVLGRIFANFCIGK